MQLTLTRGQKVSALDESNAQHVRAAEACLEQGDVEEACNELRKIQLAVASHPKVVQLRRRLVSVICGWEEETTSEAAVR